MTRWVRIFSPLFVTSLVAFVGSALSVGLLHDTVLACTVGFRTSGQPLSAGQAAQCPSYDVASGILIAVALVAGAALIWLGVRFFKAGSAERPENEGSDLGEGSGSHPSRGGPLSWLLARPTYQWVCVLVAVFFTASFFAESWLYFHLVSVSGDLSINQQLLSSTVLGGKPYPFYNVFTCTRFGQCSYLQEHQAFVAYAAALAYGVAPTPYTLFALQSLALGLGALPLYALAVDVIGSRRLSFLVAGAYLAWLPFFIVAARDTFHWEAFIPVEMLTVFWLWNRQWYKLAIPVVLVSFLTYEVIPVLAFFIGLYFFWPWLVKAVHLFFQAAFGGLAGPRSAPSKLRHWARWIWKSVHVPEVYASLALMTGSVAAYALLRLFGLYAGVLLGVPPVPSAFAPASFAGIPLNRGLTVSFAALSFMWQSKLLFWILIYLTLGFIPLFAPRTLLLVLPWIAFTVLNTSSSFWIFGPHFFVAAAAVLIGFTFGLNRLYLWISPKSAGPTADPRTAVSPPRSVPTEARSVRTSPLRPWTLDGSTVSGSSKVTGILSAGLVIIIAGNMFLNPLNPLAAPILKDLKPTVLAPYGVSYASSPNDQPLQQLLSTIPKNAVVAASKSAFTLVADDPYAYLLGGSNWPVSLLPGNESDRTEYVLLPYNTPVSDFAGTGSTLLETLYDRFDFGMRGCVSDSALGGMELFERNYTGASEVFGPADPLCPDYFSGGSGLTPGPNANILVNASSPSGVVVGSTPCAPNGTVWTGPGITLPPGKYGLHVVLNAVNTTATGHKCWKASVNPTNPLLKLNVTGQNSTGFERFYQHQVPEANLCSPACGGWYYLNTTITLSSTTSNLSINGFVLSGMRQYIVQVSYLILSPDQS